MCESRTTRAFVSFGQCSEKMVFERAIPSSSTQNVLAQYLRRILTELLRQEESGFESDYVSFRLEQLIDVLLRAESICPQSTQLVSILGRALAITENSHHEVNATVPAVFHTGQPGRPRFQIEADSLKFLLEFGFKATEIATMMSVSLRTIQRRMTAFDLREEVPRYTPLSNEGLDEMCREITREFPNCGVRRMRGFLLARNVRISWERTRETMRRIDPEGVLLRSLQLNIVHRRVYSVPGALALWHMDGNHKLIR